MQFQCFENKLSYGILHLNNGDDSQLTNYLIQPEIVACWILTSNVGMIDLPWETAMKNIEFCSENDKALTFSRDCLIVDNTSL